MTCSWDELSIRVTGRSRVPGMLDATWDLGQVDCNLSVCRRCASACCRYDSMYAYLKRTLKATPADADRMKAQVWAGWGHDPACTLVCISYHTWCLSYLHHRCHSAPAFILQLAWLIRGLSRGSAEQRELLARIPGHGPCHGMVKCALAV